MRVLATTDFNAISYPLAHPGFHFVGITMVAVDCVIGLTRMVGECWLAIFRQTGCALISGISSFGLGLKPITQSTGKRLRSSTENKTVLPGGSRKLYISARKVIELWIETRAVISWVTPTTAFLMRQLIVASRLGRTEYQLLLMKISWWDRNVKIRYKFLVVIDEFLTVSVLVCFHTLGYSCIVVVCRYRNRKHRNRVLQIENLTESNRIWEIQTDPALM